MTSSESAGHTKGSGLLLCSWTKRLIAACNSMTEEKTPRFSLLRESLAKSMAKRRERRGRDWVRGKMRIPRLAGRCHSALSSASRLRDSGRRIAAVDVSEANDLTVGIMTRVAQREREAIAREALAVAKARRARLANGWHGSRASQAAHSDRVIRQLGWSAANKRIEYIGYVRRRALASRRILMARLSSPPKMRTKAAR